MNVKVVNVRFNIIAIVVLVCFCCSSLVASLQCVDGWKIPSDTFKNAINAYYNKPDAVLKVKEYKLPNRGSKDTLKAIKAAQDGILSDAYNILYVYQKCEKRTRLDPSHMTEQRWLDYSQLPDNVINAYIDEAFVEECEPEEVYVKKMLTKPPQGALNPQEPDENPAKKVKPTISYEDVPQVSLYMGESSNSIQERYQQCKPTGGLDGVLEKEGEGYLSVFVLSDDIPVSKLDEALLPKVAPSLNTIATNGNKEISINNIRDNKFAKVIFGFHPQGVYQTILDQVAQDVAARKQAKKAALDSDNGLEMTINAVVQ